MKDTTPTETKIKKGQRPGLAKNTNGSHEIRRRRDRARKGRDG